MCDCYLFVIVAMVNSFDDDSRLAILIPPWREKNLFCEIFRLRFASLKMTCTVNTLAVTDKIDNYNMYYVKLFRPHLHVPHCDLTSFDINTHGDAFNHLSTLSSGIHVICSGEEALSIRTIAPHGDLFNIFFESC